MEQSRVPLPKGVREPYQVFVNGVRQHEGTDYEVRRGVLVFARSLEKEGKLGFGRWFLGAWGVGTYRTDDSVDVTWSAPDGSPRVAHRLDIIAPG